MGRIVIFGGTFDPFGEHHLNALRRLLVKFQTIVIAVGDRNPLKSWAPSPLEMRIRMIELVLNAEGIRIVDSPLERGVFIPRAKYWFAYQFVEWWRVVYPGLALVWAVGSDIVGEVANWKNWKEMNEVERIEVYELERLESLGSSTEIRHGVRLAHPSVREFIAEHGLYKKEF